MTRLIAIAVFVVLAFLLIRYRTSEKLQKWVVITVISGLVLYTSTLVISELIR
ncbi:hypothetical protein M1D72_15270 [Vibrio sp. AK197]|uniref:Uncharacterized protein n=1 Tax=Vibrio olivae TaxID=1243002 RepID=A0ABV5HIJ6_9VIBR